MPWEDCKCERSAACRKSDSAVGVDRISALAAAQAQSFPSNVIRIVVPTTPGSPPDVLSRVVAAELETEGWRVAVENRPGALQTIGAADVLSNLRTDTDLCDERRCDGDAGSAPNAGPGWRAILPPVIKISRSYNALVVIRRFR